MDGSQTFTPEGDGIEARDLAAETGEPTAKPESACTMAGIPIPIWRIRPAADPDDPRWQGRAIHLHTIVRAPTAAMARAIASRLDHSPDAAPCGNESLSGRSGFEDEKLYWAIRIRQADTRAVLPDDAPEAQRCGVLRISR